VNIDLQTLFYIVGIVTMFTWLVFLVVLLKIVLRVKSCMDKCKSIVSITQVVRDIFKK
jgi:hypothetical protein